MSRRFRSAHLDQMIRLAFAQEAALLSRRNGWRGARRQRRRRTAGAGRAASRQMRAQIDREERAARRRSRSARLRQIVPRVVEDRGLRGAGCRCGHTLCDSEREIGWLRR